MLFQHGLIDELRPRGSDNTNMIHRATKVHRPTARSYRSETCFNPSYNPSRPHVLGEEPRRPSCTTLTQLQGLGNFRWNRLWSWPRA